MQEVVVGGRLPCGEVSGLDQMFLKPVRPERAEADCKRADEAARAEASFPRSGMDFHGVQEMDRCSRSKRRRSIFCIAGGGEVPTPPLMRPGTRTLKKYIIFPCCVLLFGTIEEVAAYKSSIIANPHLQVLAIMAFYAFGISLIAFWLTPLLERIVLRVHSASKQSAGRIGEVMFVMLLLAGVYVLWYHIIHFGAQSLLPQDWR